MTRAFETTQSELITIRKELADTQKLLRTRQARKTGKRVALKGCYMCNTQEILEVAREAEAETTRRKSRKRQRERSINAERKGSIDEHVENEPSESESDCIVVERRDVYRKG